MAELSEARRARRIKAVEEHCRVENAHDLDGIMATFGPQASFHANTDVHVGREAVRHFYGEFLQGFPDLSFDVRAIHAGDDAIPVEMVLAGTHTGTWFGIAPTGRRFEVPVCAIYVFDDQDRLIGERGYWDNALVMRQLGLMPGG